MSISSVGTTIEGTFFLPSNFPTDKQPFHIYDLSNRLLKYGKTGTKGSFKVELVFPTPLDKEVTLIFRMCQEKKLIQQHPSLQNDPLLARNFSFLRERKETVETTVTFTLDAPYKNLGNIYFEKPYESEKVPFSYLFDIAMASLPAKLSALWESAKEKVDLFNRHGIQDILKAFNVLPVELTPANTWKLITNGICPIYFKEEGKHLVAEVNWDRYEFDKLESLPNIKIYFQKNGHEEPILRQIEAQFRTTLAPSSMPENKTKTVVYKQENISEGLRIANSVFHVYGQTVYHLGIGHVYGSQVALAVHDYLQGHPMGVLLIPHCQFIRKISDELGKTAIFGEEGVLNASALSIKGIAQLISDTLAALDPFSFRPRNPLGESHRFAMAQQLHFTLIEEAVKEYFDKNWDAIVDNWGPVHTFFNRLFKRSPLFRPWNGENLESARWNDTNEIGGNGLGLPEREKYKVDDEQVRSFRHVAKNPLSPETNDRRMIEQFSIDFIHHVTLWHSWIHRSQYVSTEASPAVLDVNFAPITINHFGQGPFIKEQEAIKQLEIGTTFKNFDIESYTLLGKKSVYEGIIKRVEKHALEYLKIGIDPHKELQFGTVI